jgi:glucan phosphoethanolaminetransferase (alkaline phosphatase superfamily)
MNPSTRRRLRDNAFASLIAEVAVYLVPTALFLSYYAKGVRESAALPHLTLISGVLGLLLAMRLAAAGRRGWQIAVTVTVAAVLLGLWVAYAVFAIGMTSWGQIPHVNMIGPYLTHGQNELFETLGLSPWAPYLAFTLVGAVSIGLCCVLHRKVSWPTVVAARTSLTTRLLILSAATALLGFRVHALRSGVWADSYEPVTMSVSSPSTDELIYVPEMHNAANDVSERALATAYTPSTQRPKRNVIVIVSDALRADRMSLLGYQRTTTPQLQRVCETEARCETRRAVAACAESYCGLMSIIRGKPFPESSRYSLRLGDVLRLHGYQHRLYLSGDHTSFYGLHRAFGEREAYWDGSLSNGYVNDDDNLLHQLKKLPPSGPQPSYLHFHLMSTHALGLRKEHRYQPSVNYYSKKLKGNEHNLAAFNNFYDNGVLQFDSVSARLLAMLQDKGYLHDALVLVTSDHGELLGEHGLFSHSFHVYQPLLNVPFVLLRFGHEREAWPDKVLAQIDLAPTVVDELGLAQPKAWRGIPAASAAQHQFISFEQSQLTGLLDVRDAARPRKFWVDTTRDRSFFVDLLNDPKEANADTAHPPVEAFSLYKTVLAPSIRRMQSHLGKTRHASSHDHP